MNLQNVIASYESVYDLLLVIFDRTDNLFKVYRQTDCENGTFLIETRNHFEAFKYFETQISLINDGLKRHIKTYKLPCCDSVYEDKTIQGIDAAHQKAEQSMNIKKTSQELSYEDVIKDIADKIRRFSYETTYETNFKAYLRNELYDETEGYKTINFPDGISIDYSKDPDEDFDTYRIHTIRLIEDVENALGEQYEITYPEDKELFKSNYISVDIDHKIYKDKVIAETITSMIRHEISRFENYGISSNREMEELAMKIVSKNIDIMYSTICNLLVHDEEHQIDPYDILNARVLRPLFEEMIDSNVFPGETHLFLFSYLRRPCEKELGSFSKV